MEISVIICTHNPRPQYFARVLEALRGQTLPMEQWELLIIDNASREPLTVVTWELSWHPHARIVREDELGLSAARMRGMREAAAELLVFVDDDNILAADYLAESLRIDREWPRLGVWGGSIVPEFEAEPAEYLRDFVGILALREIKTPQWGNVSSLRGADPWGAGMCVRAIVADEYCRLYTKSAIRVGDRIGHSLLSGGDTEICCVACAIGLGMGLFPTLKLVHLIPKERIDEDYIVRIYTGIQTSLHVIDYKWHGLVPSSPYTIMNVLHVCKQFLLERRFQRRLYIARLRAIAAARRTIAVGENQTPALLKNPRVISS